MSPAETLRQAANLMRDRADAATSGDWVRNGFEYDNESDRFTYDVGISGSARTPAYTETEADADHIACWHPAVALAVADCLHTAGVDLWAHGPLCECGTGCDACDDNLWEPHVRAALALARAYLRIDS